MAKWLGVILGAVIGNSFNVTALVLCAVIGYLLGVWLERRSDPILRHRKYLSKDQEAFHHLLHQSTFLMMGYLAKSDGRVSEQEIATAERIFDSFQLDSAGRQDAIRLFNAGKDSDFQLDTILQPLSSVAKKHRALIRVFLEIQAKIVIADGNTKGSTHRPFIVLAKQLGFSEKAATNILRQVGATRRSEVNSKETLPLDDAYTLLDVEANCSQSELKLAYRKAMSEHHPDKLMSQGATEQMIQTATEQAQSIQAAYQQIKSARALS